jgi:hypothetical protein
VAQSHERVLDACAGAQRDLALQRAAALEDGDLRDAPPARRRCIGTTLPGSSSAARAGRAGSAAGSVPVSVENSSICSRTTLPMRRTPSRISASLTPEKFSRISEPPRPSR